MASAGVVRRAVFWATALMLLAVAGCSGSPSEPEPTFRPQPAPADGFDVGTLTLGVLVDLSGPAAEADRAALAGVRAYWAGVNARGGVAQLYSVELSVRDLGDVEAAAAALEGWDIAALAYVSAGVDTAEFTRPRRTSSGAPSEVPSDVSLTHLPLPAVPAVATLGGEDLAWVLTSTTPVELTTVALLDRFRASGPGATWCVVVDGSHLGSQVAAAAHVAGAARETVPAMLDLDVGEIEVLDLSASVFDVADAVADRRCRYVLVEVAEPRATGVLEQLPPNLTVVRRATLAGELELPAQVELFIDPAPPWTAGQSAVMDAFAADWASFASGSQPVSGTRAGWLSQLRLHALLEDAFAGGDVSRELLVELSGLVEPVDPDRNTLPGVARLGMDISEPVGGGPLRTLRLYGRSDVGADASGLRQVLLYDATRFVEELRDRLSTRG
ncbi:hypothetical protein [Candidatus Poriferisodalis sp.]|uniref:hypothetical protein n=1 Tax=Candidatus Poriferisodalis sp. TaxID=3101277 RepID=UPI003B59EB31